MHDPDVSCIFAGMPTNKMKQQGAKVGTGGADDDFNRILAEVTAEDSQLPPDVPASKDITANMASSSSSSSSDGPRALSPGLQVSRIRSLLLANGATSLNFDYGAGKATMIL
jgi:hypothetical protein